MLILALFILTSCNIEVQSDNPVTSVPLIITATLPPVAIPRPSETQPPPSPQPTVAPLNGNASTALNVRAEPSTASEVIGILPANSNVYIVGKDIGGNWWQIIYETGKDGKGWITAQYVETNGNADIPVVGGDASNQKPGNLAVVIQELNIRSGPGTGFNSLGVLNTNDVISLTGKNTDGTWLQIDYSEGPDGAGWVNSAFVKTETLESLPIVSNQGEVIGTGTPTETLLPPTPTIIPASMDFDTADAPLKTISFNRTGTNTFIYNGDVSAPNGDTDDWIAFIPYGDTVFVDIQCGGSKSIRVEFDSSDTAALCGQSTTAINVPAGSETLIHILAISSSDQLNYTNYTLTIRANP